MRQPKKKIRLRVKQLAKIDRFLLQNSGIRGLIIDLDNTVISEDDLYLSPHAEAWIQSALQEGMKVFILSNGKRKYRVNYWSSRLGVAAISPARKPLPFSFRKALSRMRLKPHQVVVIGDSFHTDIIGAYLAGCSCIQVASLPHPPRWWERLVGKWLQIPYSEVEELWPFDCNYP